MKITGKKTYEAETDSGMLLNPLINQENLRAIIMYMQVFNNSANPPNQISKHITVFTL